MITGEQFGLGADVLDDGSDAEAVSPGMSRQRVAREDRICGDALVRACIRRQSDVTPFQELVIDMAFSNDPRFGISPQRSSSESA